MFSLFRGNDERPFVCLDPRRHVRVPVARIGDVVAGDATVLRHKRYDAAVRLLHKPVRPDLGELEKRA